MEFLKQLILESTGMDLMKSFFSLCKTDGKFKSEKQKQFLLSKCNYGENTFKVIDTLKFGEHGGASASVTWIVIMDQDGVVKITKETKTKGIQIYWERTAEFFDKQAKRADIRKQEHIKQLESDIKMYNDDIIEAKKKYDETNNEYKKWVAEMKPKLVDAIGLEYANEVEHNHYKNLKIDDQLNRIQTISQLVVDLKDKLENLRAIT